MSQLVGTAVKGYLLKNPITWIFIAIGLFFSALIFTIALFLMSISNTNEGTTGQEIGGTASVSPQVLRWEPLVRKYAAENGIEQYTAYILALIQQESGGNCLDVMQSSESIGLPPNSITDPELSIKIGVHYFAQVLQQSKGDIKLALQSYNFGGGFIPFALEHGGYSKETAIAFSSLMAARNGWRSYGDINYVDHVLRYVSGAGVEVVGDGSQRFDVEEVHNIMKKFLGMPYVWGGRTPAAGGFDCSGLIEYAFAQVGIDMSGTAQSQYDKTRPIPDNQAKPGDLVFFSTYKAGASHVGMYVGNGQFINSNDNGVSYSSLERYKNLYPFLGFRRIQ